MELVVYSLAAWIAWIVWIGVPSAAVTINGNFESNGVYITSEETDRTEVLGITTGHGVLVVATKKRLLIFTDDEQRRLVGKVQLPFIERTVLFELKVFSQSEIFYCDETNCGLCTFSGLNSSCSKLGRSEYDMVRITSAAVVQMASSELLMLRVTFRDSSNQEQALVLRLKAQDNGTLTTNVTATEAPYISEYRTALGFERNGYIYFVNSDRQPVEPLANMQKNINRSTVKVTRICAADTSLDLASKMSVPLECENFYGNLEGEQFVEASVFDEKTDQLIVTFGSLDKEHRVCGFKMANMEKQFDQEWDLCQQTTAADGQSCEYERNQEELLRKRYCSIFSHMAGRFSTTVCSKFGGKGPVLGNCEVGLAIGSSYRYGWLESYNTFNGHLIFELAKSSNINVVHSIALDKDAFYAAVTIGNESVVIRGSQHDGQIVWQTPTFSSSLFALAKVSETDPLMVTYTSDDEVKGIRTSCEWLYSTCKSLSEGGWKDPLDCSWCTSSAPRKAIPASNSGTCARSIQKACPPLITHVSRLPNQRGLSVFGDSLRAMKNPYVKICDQKCVIKENTDHQFVCEMESGSMGSDCKLSLIGQLGDVPDYSIDIDPTNVKADESTQQRQNSSKSTRTTKAIIAVVVTVAILAILALLIYFVRRKTKVIIPETTPAVSNNYNKPDNSFPMVSNGVGKTEYARLFQELEMEKKVDFKKLQVDKTACLGKGFFGVVYKGTFSPQKDVSIDVACKYMLAGRVTEFYAEASVQREFDHARVLKLIGLSLDTDSSPIAVTPFMPFGDLKRFVENNQNQFTLRDLLRFAIEIADGMAHIHSRGYVHRDLAARNCMLDDHKRVKIADFGLCRKLDAQEQLYRAVGQRELPLRWMPPEIIDQEFGYKCDVWSYGVLLWELTTRGRLPYDTMSNDVLNNWIRQDSKNRLTCPDHCPEVLYARAMWPCWLRDPEERPTFVELVNVVNSVVHDLERAHDENLHKVYERIPGVHRPSDTSEPV